MAFDSRHEEGAVSNSAAAVYTVPASTEGRVLKATVTNDDTAAAHWLSVWLVESGGSAAQTNRLINVLDIPPADGEGGTVTLEALIGHTLDAGDAIHMQAETASKLNYHLTIMEKS